MKKYEKDLCRKKGTKKRPPQHAGLVEVKDIFTLTQAKKINIP